jgi:hypothetical protein
MDKLRINLLPPEIKEQAKKAAKQNVINKISVGLLGLLIVITGGILGVVIYQGTLINNLNNNITNEKNRIQSLGEAEAIVKLLKNRIDTINQFDTNSYKQGQVYELITGLIPRGIQVNVVKITKNPTVVLQADTDNTISLQNLLNDLVDPVKNQSKITSVTVESLNKNSAGKISFELTIHLAGGVL